MVLLVGGEPLAGPPDHPNQLFDQFPGLLEAARQFADKPAKKVEPQGVMYVRQKQWGVTYPGHCLDNGEKVVCCGTEDVLTCHIIIMRDPTTGVAAIAHFDEFTKRKAFENMTKSFLDRVRQAMEEDWQYIDEEEEETEWEYWDDDGDDDGLVVLDPDVVYDLYLVGGYKDDAGKAQKISQRFFKHLHELTIRLNVQICCLGEPNTKRPHRGGTAQPKICGLCLDTTTGSLSPATFNRTFTDFTEDIRDLLLCYPPLIKNKSRLKMLISKQEDRGYGFSQALCA